MSVPPAAEAVFKAHQARATGELRMRAGGRVSVLGFRDGDLVAADVTFGYQGMAQSLLGGHRIDLSTLDALWARGDWARDGIWYTSDTARYSLHTYRGRIWYWQLSGGRGAPR